MAKATAKKFSSVMSKSLLDRMKKQAERNGQSVRFVLERAVEHYLDVVVPSSEKVRPEIIAFGEESIRDNMDLMKRLAKAK
ncbi:MAG: hypothetical protein ACRD5W_00090 [Candidatus Acidiferrales bacterium]